MVRWVFVKEADMTDGMIDPMIFNDLKDTMGADFMGELINAFLEEAPGLIAQLRPSLEKGDAETFRRMAHSVKTNAATFGVTPLQVLAKELEFMARENRLDEVGDRIERLEKIFAQAAEELKGLCS
jgi:HPt (histidine-containing phosphotransfer) domain-containing protein